MVTSRPYGQVAEPLVVCTFRPAGPKSILIRSRRPNHHLESFSRVILTLAKFMTVQFRTFQVQKAPMET